MNEKIKVSTLLTQEEYEMLEIYKGELSTSKGLRLMVQSLSNKRYIMPELCKNLINMEKIIKEVGDNIPEKYYPEISKILKAGENVWQTLSR